MAGEFVVVYDLLPEIAAKIDDVAGKVVRKSAFDIQAAAQATAPVDTGFLKNSIYVVMRDVSTYSTVQAPEADQALLPEVDKPAESTTAFIAVAANYGLYVEYGTSRAAAQPYLTPAVELVKPQFEKAMDKIIELMNVSAVK